MSQRPAWEKRRSNMQATQTLAGGWGRPRMACTLLHTLPLLVGNLPCQNGNPLSEPVHIIFAAPHKLRHMVKTNSKRNPKELVNHQARWPGTNQT